MMDEAGDGRDAPFPKSAEAIVGESPIPFFRPLRSGSFPEDGVSKRFDPKFGDAVEVIQPAEVPAFLELIVKAVADAVDRAFQTSPEFSFALHHKPRRGSRPLKGRLPRQT